jgi:hypothetical protein
VSHVQRSVRGIWAGSLKAKTPWNGKSDTPDDVLRLFKGVPTYEMTYPFKRKLHPNEDGYPTVNIQAISLRSRSIQSFHVAIASGK